MLMAYTRFGDNTVSIERLDVSAYTIPTDFPESDGTYAWDKTTLVVVEASGGGKRGLGYTYADVSTATLIKKMLVDVVRGRDAMAVPGCWLAMVEAIRNLGRPGISSMAIAAVDAALWDLKARLLDVPLVALAAIFAESGVSWFEEPVSSDDLEGLRLIRDRAPAGMDIAAGEYGYDLWYFRRMLEAGAVDVLQADATRCAGITGFMRVGALCEARSLQLSAHCGPSLHAHPCCALNNFRHLEYFHDHARIEHMLFDGVLTPINGALRPDLSRPGMGLELKRSDAEKYSV